MLQKKEQLKNGRAASFVENTQGRRMENNDI